MNKTYLKSAITTFGILATTIAIEGQGAGGGSVGGTASGVQVGGVGGARGPTATTARRATATVGSTVGAASINGPAGPTVGASSVIGNSPGIVAPTATLPGGGISANQVSVPMAALPAPVQTALQAVGVNGQVGSITQVQGLNGPTYQAQVTENGLPVELQLSQTGQILSRTPISTAVGVSGNTLTTGTTPLNAEAGIPVSTLPQAVQSAIQSQIGTAGQVQTVSRDDLASGTVYRVTTLQNGVPTELRVGANGSFLGTSALNGTATSAFNPSVGAVTGVIPGSAVVLGDLPSAVQTSIGSQLSGGHMSQLTRLQGTNGTLYAVSYSDTSGNPRVMTVAPNGQVISNNPITGVGGAAGRSIGSGTSTNSATGGTNSTGRTSMNIDQLPAPVREALKREAKYAEVRSITREKRIGGDIFTVAVRGDNTVGDLTLDNDGKVLSDTRRNYAELSVPKVDMDDEKVSGIPFNTLPQAIKESVAAYAAASDIRSVQLQPDRDGKAVYDIVFYRDGRRERLVVEKNGTLRRLEENVPPTSELPNSNKAPVIATGDLPQAVRDTIRRETQGVRVQDIQSRQLGSETVYQVRYHTNGAPMELMVGMDGRVVLPEGSIHRDAPGAPAQAPISTAELADARVVNAVPAPVSIVNTGAAAAAERGSLRSTTLKNSNADVSAVTQEPIPTTKVNISDAPVPVQNAAKKLAGTANLASITPKLSDAGVRYEVVYEENGLRKTVLVNKDGAVVNE